MVSRGDADNDAKYVNKSGLAMCSSMQLLMRTIVGYCQSEQNDKPVNSKDPSGAPESISVEPVSSVKKMQRSVDVKKLDAEPKDKNTESDFSAKQMFLSLLDCCFKYYGDNNHKTEAAYPPPANIGRPVMEFHEFAEKSTGKKLFHDIVEFCEYQRLYEQYVDSLEDGNPADFPYQDLVKLMSKKPEIKHPSPKKELPGVTEDAMKEQGINLSSDAGKPCAKSAFTRVSAGGLFHKKGQEDAVVPTPDADRPSSVVSFSSTDTATLTESSGSRPVSPNR